LEQDFHVPVRFADVLPTPIREQARDDSHTIAGLESRFGRSIAPLCSRIAAMISSGT
jgi:hypothetical protein